MSITLTLRNKRGMSLVELLIAMVVFSAVIAGALGFMRSQTVGFRKGGERMDLLQNLRFSINLVEADLRTMGANVPDQQPVLVYAGEVVIAFNADYATNVANDPFAVYYDPDAPSGRVTAMTTAQQTTLSNTAFTYPSQNYQQGPLNSPAELLTFFLTPDSSTTRTDDYALFRQVNDGQAELIARNLLQTTGQPFFEYSRLLAPAGQPQSIQVIAGADLPLAHVAPIQNSPADTGQSAVIDSIRGVRVSFTATNGIVGADERTRAISRLVRLPNMGMASKKTCGDEPILGVALVAAFLVQPGGEPSVRLTWAKAVDEGAGENDVVRYVLWRRLQGAPDWGEPYLSLPAGLANYTYEDLAVASGNSYEFALAAQDCTPQLSSLALSIAVAIP